jgi:ABC-type cobalamin/Fe3+-siderophores transport system ATPase subunit
MARNNSRKPEDGAITSSKALGSDLPSGGSEWRQWDIHVHTPETILNNQFGDWEEYLKEIESHPHVRALGVTDYMSITNYSKLKTFKNGSRITNIDLLIPNIEFRIAPPTDKATAINIHLLVSPDDPQHEQEILNALARLDWEYNKRRYSCLPAQLIALGRAFDPAIKDDGAALRAGVTQFKVDFTRFREWYSAEPWLKRNSLVAVAAGEDGLSGFRRDGAWAAHRDEITRFSQIIFSGRPGERDFWLGLGAPEDKQTVNRLGGVRPCLHGSDAHEIAKVFKPDKDRFCWIKADTTFEGLKQVLYEPGDRVHIGPSPPIYHDQARVIRAVKLSNASGWFDDISVPLNTGLVSIIGQKGSGKSALAELIAYAAGSWHTDDAGSFLHRAGSHIQDLFIELEWADGTTSPVKLWDDQSGANQVRYLSQKFVERLCADDNIGNELVREIESVIFSYIDPTDTLNASSFEELRAIRTEGVRAEGDRLRDDVIRLIREECDLRDSIAKLPEKQSRIKTLTEERDGLVKQLPKAASPEEARLQKDLQDKRHSLTLAQQAAAVDKQKLQKISDIRTRVSTFKSQASRFYSDIEGLLKDADIPAADRALFRPAFPADTEPSLTRREAELKRILAQRDGSADNPAEGTIQWLQRQIQTLLQQDSADKARQEKIKVIQARITAIGTELERVQTEIARIEGPDKERLVAARQERLDVYVAFFQNLKQEQRTLEELYAPVKTRLSSTSASEQEQDLEFSIRWEADMNKWLERGSVLFDQRKTIPYGTMQDLGDAARHILAPAWTSGDPEKIRASHGEFIAEFRKPGLAPANYLRSGVSLFDVLQWLYEVDHIHLTYGLKYNGVELEKLSPGTKGIVLLILYLGMDVADTRPLVVDQPDENLDNESIYKLLTTYFKTAKTRRQIILITHNPNLVVNADSEQVIVATCDRREDGLPHITYQSGALENISPTDKGIRQQVCRILEGGADAFLKRERRYSLADQHA